MFLKCSLKAKPWKPWCFGAWHYWCLAMDMFPKLCEKALSVFIPFMTTYLCHSGFSALLSNKIESRNRLNAQADMWVAISNKLPRFEKLLSNKQEQKSH